MANRAMLYLNRSGDPNYEYSERIDVLAAANYFIPVLWCSIFTPDDLIWCDTRFDPDELEEGIDYEMTFPSLLTPLASARARAKSHRSYFFQFFPDHLNAMYDQWLSLLYSEDAPSIQIGTQDLWAMSDTTPRFTATLNTFVQAFEEQNLEDLRKLLWQVDIQLDIDTKTVVFNEDDIRYHLGGSTWVRTVPWEDD